MARAVLDMAAMKGILETTRGVLEMTGGLPDKSRNWGEENPTRVVRGGLGTTRILTSEKASVVVRTLGTIN